MAYLGLARKWRSQTFDDLIGQKHIALTLSNAIQTDRLSQGYLFTGTRGVGKTSAARILAKSLRCPNVQGVNPCGKCTDCIEIAEGRSVDVLEIDGASNNGVDAVREIRENAKYLPSSGKRKIYIIDEVHMLTTAAFNALLKTLEEPPPHVLFIFATTDPQKIPNTVLSRCQRFDFKRIPLKELQERLLQICQAEKVSISNDALVILAREAEGSMRDALSLLDQVLSIGGTEITGKTITDSLGLVDKQTVLDCVRGVLERKPLLALEAVGKVYLHGFDLKQFGREVLRELRLVMLAQLLSQNQANMSQYLDVSDVDLEDIKSLIGARSLEDLDMLFRLLNHGLEDVARSSIPKTVMDVLFIKMAATEELIPLAAVNENTLKEMSETQEEVQESVMRAPLPPAPKPEIQAAPSAEAVTEQWKKAVSFVRGQKPLVGSVLENFGLSGMESDSKTGQYVVRLTHSKDHTFYREQLQSRAYQEALLQLLKAFFGRAVRLEYQEVISNKPVETLEEQKRKKILESEAFQAAQQLLGATVEKLDVRI